MINPKDLYEIFLQNGITFFTGVPDSLLKDFCSYVSDKAGSENHIISTNEGSALGLASGYYLSTGKPALVYMQNSGLGNSVNPLLSLADSEVYGIPVLLMIGWRGEPGKKDEPQHIKQGRVMLKMLDAMEIPFVIIDRDSDDLKEIIRRLCNLINEKNSPAALIVREGTFDKYELKKEKDAELNLSREEVLTLILDNLELKDIVVTTTGKTSRELYEYRERRKQSHENDFLTVGSMGHSSQIALGIALRKKDKQIFAIDGDGALLMHLGSMAIIGTSAPDNYKHILINNGSHESVGGQPTAGFKVSFPDIAKACGYKQFTAACKGDEVKREINNLKLCKGPAFLEIRVNKVSRANLGRPSGSPQDNKNIFMKFLSE